MAAPTSTMSVAQKPLWLHPYPRSTRVDAFRRIVNRKYRLNLTTYAELYRWSIDELEKFCAEVWIFCGLIYSKPPVATAFGLEKMWPRPHWFPGAKLNYTENMLCVGLSVHPDAVAVSACREGGTEWRHLTWKQLRDEVERYTSAFKQAGIKKGDRVASELLMQSR